MPDEIEENEEPLPTESMEDLSALIDAQLSGYNKGFSPGEKVTGVVVDIGPETIVVDLNAKREGCIETAAFTDAEGHVSVAVGETIDAYFVQIRDGAFWLATEFGGAAADQTLRRAFESKLPVEGFVKGEINGGYEVTVSGKRAFCPYSQMDLYRQENAEYVGHKFIFMVSEFEEEGHNAVVSRREFLEQERAEQSEALKAELAVGDLCEGKVVNIMPFGVFVDLGGVQGLVPLKELAWERDVKPEDVVSLGDTVGVVVQSIDWAKERLSLSLRYAKGDPWRDLATRYGIGSCLRVKVTRLMDFGAFAELEPGIEGLIHISKLGFGRRLQHAREAVSEGDELEVEIESVDSEQHRIGLKPVDKRMASLHEGPLSPGSAIKGIVESAREFGVFVRVSEDLTGLLHVSETDVGRGGNIVAKLEHTFEPGSEIDVIVKSVEGKRISLTLPGKWEDPSEQIDVHDYLNTSTGGLGSLGDAFDGLKL